MARLQNECGFNWKCTATAKNAITVLNKELEKVTAKISDLKNKNETLPKGD